MRYLDPKSDVTFEKVFGEHKELLISFLNAMLSIKENNVTQQEREQVRLYLEQHPSELESVMMMMDEDYDMEPNSTDCFDDIFCETEWNEDAFMQVRNRKNNSSFKGTSISQNCFALCCFNDPFDASLDKSKTFDNLLNHLLNEL